MNRLPRRGPALLGHRRSAVQLDEAAHQREPDAEAPADAGERMLGLAERLEHVRQHLGRDADAVVHDLEYRLVARAPHSRVMRPPSGV